MEDKPIALATKPGASLHVSLLRPREGAQGGRLAGTLVVFLNGLALPCAAWTGAIDRLVQARSEAKRRIPALLCYDRYGQGKSDPDPTDPECTPYGHDARAVVADLHQLLVQVCRDELGGALEDTRLVFVCNSIGCVLARLYAAEHPRRVGAYLFLDSMMAHTDFVSLFPDPDGPGFDESRLPVGVTADDLRHARSMFARFFHPTVPNAERLDRRRLGELLPLADGPPLPDSPEGKPPQLVVVGHDWDEFADQSEKGSLAVSKAVINAYLNPPWGTYNEGLTRLVQPKSEVNIAKGCGHFIQKDDPGFVAAEIDGILNSLE